MFVGSAVAIVTPFDKNNEVNYFELKNLIDYQIANGTKAIVVLGTTGESSTISRLERTKIIKFCVNIVSKKIPLIVGTGSNSTKTSIELTKEAEELGADALLIVTPYYNKTTQQGLIAHYTEIAKSVRPLYETKGLKLTEQENGSYTLTTYAGLYLILVYDTVDEVYNPMIVGLGYDENKSGTSNQLQNGTVNAEQKTFAITNSTLKSACAESDDAVIVIRTSATKAKLTLTSTALIGERQIIGNTTDTQIIVK